MTQRESITSEQLFHYLKQEVKREELVWPAETAWEMVLGAILVQNTSWTNTILALEKVKKATAYDPEQLLDMELEAIQALIYSAGFYRNKSKAVQGFLQWMAAYDFSFERVKAHFNTSAALRKELLSLHGIGPETADVLLLYLFERPAFIADAYARRLYQALGCQAATSYPKLKHFVEETTALTLEDWQVFHLLILEYGKEYFRGKGPYRSPLTDKYQIRCG